MPELVKDQLMDWIMDGIIQMGDQLNTNDLAERMGVSTQPVRDALKILEKSGIVYSIPFVGTRIVDLSSKDILEIYLVRKALEPMAGYYACQNYAEDYFSDIQSVLDMQKNIFDRQEPNAKEIFILNREYHFRIYEISNMPHLVNMIGTLWDKLAFYKLIYGRRYVVNKAVGQEMLNEHANYFDLLRKRDGDGLKAAMEKSLQKHVQELEEKIASKG